MPESDFYILVIFVLAPFFLFGLAFIAGIIIGGE